MFSSLYSMERLDLVGTRKAQKSFVPDSEFVFMNEMCFDES